MSDCTHKNHTGPTQAMMEDGDERFVCLDCGRRFPGVNKDMTKYPPHWLPLAKERGWDQAAHQRALDSGDWDQITITHPTNWLTEAEVESGG